MKPAEAALLVEQLSLLKFFPADEGARMAVSRLLQRMCDSFEQGQWLVEQCIDHLNEWPGPGGLRRIFSAKFRPADGLVPSACSCGCGKETLFQLAPAQAWPPGIAAAEMKLLPAPALNPEVLPPLRTGSTEAAVKIAVKAKDTLDAAFLGPATKEEIANAPEWLRHIEGYDA